MKKNVGTSYFKDLSRKDYVVQASRIIKKEGVEAISIRRIAAELGCSSASMYRYFQNLDELCFMPSWTRSTSISWICQNVKRSGMISGMCISVYGVPMPKRHLRSPRPLKLFLPEHKPGPGRGPEGIL